jgi:hypothetical protein
MKTKYTSIITITILAASTLLASAQPGAGRRGGNGPGADMQRPAPPDPLEMADKLLDDFDADNSGSLDEQELAEGLEALWQSRPKPPRQGRRGGFGNGPDEERGAPRGPGAESDDQRPGPPGRRGGRGARGGNNDAQAENPDDADRPGRGFRGPRGQRGPNHEMVANHMLRNFDENNDGELQDGELVEALSNRPGPRGKRPCFAEGCEREDCPRKADSDGEAAR